MSGRRFQVTYSNQTIFVDRLRFGCDTDLDRAFLGACADDPEDVDLNQQPVMFDIPKQDLAAYRRACAAFNAVMNEHEQQIARKNARRRTRNRSPTLEEAVMAEAGRILDEMEGPDHARNPKPRKAA